MVKLLISRGANPTLADSQGFTPLISAADCYDPMGETEIIEYLLRIKAVRAAIDAQDDDGNTALTRAGRWVEVVKLLVLVEAGANPMIANEDGRTPMDMAQALRHQKSIALLQVGRCSRRRRMSRT